MGRRKIRDEIEVLIIASLNRLGMVTTDKIRSEITLKTSRKVSWNTVQKYADGLVEMGKIKKLESDKSRQKYQKGRVYYYRT